MIDRLADLFPLSLYQRSGMIDRLAGLFSLSLSIRDQAGLIG